MPMLNQDFSPYGIHLTRRDDEALTELLRRLASRERVEAMIGFHDHIVNRRSGRPEPHISWQVERFITWTGWSMAAISIAGAAYYYQKWGELDGAMPMLGGAILFAVIAYARQKALERKKLEFRRAVDAYETMLDSAARYLR